MKKFLVTILITTALFGGIPGIFALNTAQATVTAPAGSGAANAGASLAAAQGGAMQRAQRECLGGNKLVGLLRFLNPINAWCVIGKTFARSEIVADIFDQTAGRLVYGFGYLIFHISAVFLSISAFILDQSISVSLFGIGQIEVISEGWGVARDLANMFFIFILLYIAIATILQVEGFNTKKLLTNVIIVALLVNFSLVITKIVIDTSNILALGFYNSLTDNDSPSTSISKKFMAGLNLQTILETNTITDDNIGNEKPAVFTNVNTATVFIGGTVLVLVTSFVFFAIGLLFVIRSVVLMFLMVLSPLAFLAGVLPATSQYSKKWWDELFSQSFFAPACLFMIYFIATIIDGIRVLGTNNSISARTFSEAFNGDPAHYSIIFNFIILIAMMVAALIIAKSMGAYGAETMMKWGQAARKAGQGFVGRHTIGRAAAVIAGAETTKRVLGAVPGGRYVSQGLNAVAGGSFGGAKGGYTGAVKKTAERQAAYADYLGKGEGGAERQATYIKSLEGGAFAKGLRTVTGIGAAAPLAVKMIEKNTAKQSAKKNKEAELVKLEEEHKKLEEIPKEKDETRLQELKVARTLTTHPGVMANINDEIAEINKRKERRIEVLNRMNDVRDRLEMAENIKGLSGERGKEGGASSGDEGKPSK